MSDVTTAGAQAGEQPTELKRAIGPKLLMFFVVGDILGTGIYALTGDVANQIGGALWLPFLGAFLIAFLTAFSYLELVGKYPRAAGAALYVNRAFGIPFVTFVIGFAVMCSGITSASSAAIAFGDDYLQEFVTFPVVLAAIGFVLLIALINFRGVSESVKINLGLTAVEISGLLIIIAIGVYAVLTGAGEPGRLTEIDTSQAGSTFTAITAATSLAFFAMVGFEDSVNMAEECKQPARIFPRALLTGMAIAGSIYVLVAITSSLLVSVGELRDAEPGAVDNALLKVVENGAPGFPLELFAAIGLLAVINSALINMLMASRLVYGMSRERIIPRGFGTVHPFRRTPWVSIVFTSAIAVVLVSFGSVGELGGTTSLLLLAVFAVVNVACLVLRRETVEHKHFRAPTWAPVLGAILSVFLVIPGLSGRDAVQYYIAGVLIAAGIVLWFVNRAVTGRVDVGSAKLSKDP